MCRQNAAESVRQGNHLRREAAKFWLNSLTDSAGDVKNSLMRLPGVGRLIC